MAGRVRWQAGRRAGGQAGRRAAALPAGFGRDGGARRLQRKRWRAGGWVGWVGRERAGARGGVEPRERGRGRASDRDMHEYIYIYIYILMRPGT